MASFHETFFERLVRFAPDALIVVRAGRIVLANDRAQEMFGYRQDEMLDRRLEALFPGLCGGSSARHLVDPASAPKGEDVVLIGLRKDGSEFPVAATLRQVEAGGESFLVFAIRDSTRCSQSEAGLRARVHQQALVAELGRRALVGIALALQELDRVLVPLLVGGWCKGMGRRRRQRVDAGEGARR